MASMRATRPKTESVNDSISEKREVAEANIVKDDGVDVEATEAEEEEELFTESIEMPTFRMR